MVSLIALRFQITDRQLNNRSDSCGVLRQTNQTREGAYSIASVPVVDHEGRAESENAIVSVCATLKWKKHGMKEKSYYKLQMPSKVRVLTEIVLI